MFLFYLQMVSDVPSNFWGMDDTTRQGYIVGDARVLSDVVPRSNWKLHTESSIFH